ncbi:hypothetical protein vBSmQDWS359_22 [Stenotrophomonas phage vB_Sm_QDWS359]|uniref:Uncharacterized protein n=1 Tax=Stenotrophomonas phage vB_Sm_QDWS359 TaxID=2943841 RepID=A0A9E7DKT8_9CAUD|nr:hypothetical protein P9A46_gp22 [Stenotrophomonas phage vB_Sm_QDWS359]UQM93939.1 hypothetical protein vBSmQDWS359_22 [Stenotrophomonas phage vB_Sm_QDWS359]
MSGTTSQKFVLVGPHAGKSMAVNGHEFVDGEFTFQGSSAQIAVLANVLSFYGAVPAEKAELEQLRAEKSQGEQTPAPAGDKGGEQTQAPAAPVGSDTNDKDVKDPVLPTLAEAIGMLDPENDAHWTSNNLPGLDDLSKLTGKAVSRADVEAIAAGYTRAKARQAKASN